MLEDEVPSEKWQLPASGFERFWAAFPKHDHQEGARTEYKRAIKSGEVTHEQLLTGAENYAARCEAESTSSRYIKLAKNWLRDKRWTDAPLTAAERMSPLAYGAAQAAGLLDDELDQFSEDSLR